MTPSDLLFWATWGFVLAQRLVELVISERNRRSLLSEGAEPARRDGFLILATAHVMLLAGGAVEWNRAPWPDLHVLTAPFLAVAALAMGLRYWAAASLGRFYTVRVLRLPGAALVSRGPYRWMRHPIYRAVAVEVAALPVAFGLWVTGAAAVAINLVALGWRIRAEERHLGLDPR